MAQLRMARRSRQLAGDGLWTSETFDRPRQATQSFRGGLTEIQLPTY
jgi:hypothetical protein